MLVKFENGWVIPVLAIASQVAKLFVEEHQSRTVPREPVKDTAPLLLPAQTDVAPTSWPPTDGKSTDTHTGVE